MRSDAVISACGLYRYCLTREWGDAVRRRVALWVMLNPSTADALQDDPTTRRCIGYSKAWGFDGLIVVNLYAYRATQPAELWKAPDPVGPDNDDYILASAARASIIIAAWGSNANPERAAKVSTLLRQRGRLHALALTKDRKPKHPLYLPGALRPQPVEALLGSAP